MSILPELIETVIILAILAYIIRRIYRHREDEETDADIDKFEVDREQELKNKHPHFAVDREQELKNKYPHLVGKLEGNWLEVFALNAERGTLS
jgi:hypothetical protein